VRPRVQFQKLRPDAVVPRYMTELASGLDLCAAIDEPITVCGHQRVTIDTGLAIAIPPGYEGQVRPRSGLARKNGITCLNSPGTIDADYRGTVQILLINTDDEPFVIRPGERIAQLVIAPVVQAELTEVDELPATARGSGGFGSTGR
jgi:dUTP pyrophosphatase